MKTFYDGLNKKKSYKIGMNINNCILTSSDEEEEDDIENQQGSLKTIKIQFSMNKKTS